MTPRAPVRALRIAPLLLASGACALVYQVAWQRELRLIFGASTAASAAVLAIFIGGLGAGGLLLGRRADRHPRPLALYAKLELGVAIASALSPLLLALARVAYQSVGGTTTLGGVGGTVARLVLAALVLAGPTLLMGGTLPAAAAAAETDDDDARRGVALLYGANTLGAVAGCALSTFVLLESLGTRRTLWTASAFNLLVAAIVSLASRSGGARAEKSKTEAASSQPASVGERAAPVSFVIAAAAIVGFVFFLLEVVWYRMLGPLLGGTVYSFGLILAVALFGIGVGGARYSFKRGRPTLTGFALTAVAEAICVAVPYALGDRLALFALLLRPLSALGFGGHVIGWTLVTAIVVLPAAIVSGAQFALLVGLLGRGRRDVGFHIALAYAANTVGAMLGALCGGFLLLPWLGAIGCWKLAAIALAILGVAAALVGKRVPRLIVPALGAAAAIVLLRAEGPTALWRHGQIGVGRVSPAQVGTPNAQKAFIEHERRSIRWEAEGVESTVAVGVDDGALRFLVNGKVDGNARTDAATQVMAGLVGSILHPRPVSSLVIGLGTGSSAGWMGAVPGMERVDVVELEPAVRRVAAECGAVNHGVLENEKVHVQFGDAREVLLTGRSRYSLIVSEPSNPYRAGVASLYSEEFYRAVADRLDDDGLFLQWVQAYEVDADTVRTVYATLHAAFPYIESWQLHSTDLLLVASRKPITWSLSRLRERIAEEPYKSALLHAWRASDVEGFVSHFVARASLADSIAKVVGESGVPIATDDRSPLEFRFARELGLHGGFSIAKARELAIVRGEDLPEFTDGRVSRERVEDERAAFQLERTTSGAVTAGWSLDQERRAEAMALYNEGNPARAWAVWKTQSREPETPLELELAAEGATESVADGNPAAALRAIEALRQIEPIETDAIMSRLHYVQGRGTESADAFLAAFTAYQRDPWPSILLMDRTLRLATDIAIHAPDRAHAMIDCLSRPFATFALDDRRLAARLAIATRLPAAEVQQAVFDAIQPYEPHVPWQAPTLLVRRNVYAAASDPRAARAEADLQAFLAAEPATFERGLIPDLLFDPTAPAKSR